ncbi:MAG TPA: hypothetical protein VF123_11890 [Candidatus Sulfotelmatobacter sp.]
MSRLFGFLSVIIVMAAGLYIYSRQVQSTSAATGTNNPKAAVNITGVRTDLMTIAQAERGYFALEGKYASLDDLISSRSLSVARQRLPYSYDIETSGSGFRVIASRTGEDNSGAPAQISVDENMQFQVVQ